MKIAFIYSSKKLSGLLTKMFTGSYCYHVAFVDDENSHMYDMHLIRRRRKWPYYSYDSHTVVMVDCPVPVSRKYLEDMLSEDNSRYGVIDYILFGIRPIYHLFGKSTRNMGGVICSEMVANDLVKNGWQVIFHEVPSPADLERELLNGREQLR